ncbi:DNA glycosylase AlkZ-like family protein [Kribbella sp. CA-253562]|uniref:DNA glycosylase AlkZ-like family protein n=1 Tax=Kribbella sp. CA-253562 TaxID=3239942 RepID=UPI003D8C5B59
MTSEQARRIAVRAQLLDADKPAAKRRWGYFALPILYGERLVGKADVKADRKAGVLRVQALHPEVRFSRAISQGIHDELADLAAWLALPEIEFVKQ